MKIICELRSEELFEGRSSQLYTQLMQLGKESLKKIQACMEFEPLTSAIPVQRSTKLTDECTMVNPFIAGSLVLFTFRPYL